MAIISHLGAILRRIWTLLSHGGGLDESSSYGKKGDRPLFTQEYSGAGERIEEGQNPAETRPGLGHGRQENPCMHRTTRG